MEKDLSNYALRKGNVPENPMELFQKWFYEIDNHFNADEGNAMTLSTFGLDGYPKNRIVLLKKYTYEGFIFYTNYESEKGKAIKENPNVCISFFFGILQKGKL